MSPTEVEERGRQFDATLDVDHSGVAERRFNQKLSLSFFFTELRSPEWLLLKNRNYDHEHDKRESLIIVAGSFCSSLL